MYEYSIIVRYIFIFIQVYDNSLIITCCSLLRSPPHRQLAAECLLSIMERKDGKDDREPLLTTFDNISALTSSVPVFSHSEEDFDSDNYTFMKRVCQVRGISMYISYTENIQTICMQYTYPINMILI